MTRYREHELVLPALRVMKEKKDHVTTSVLIDGLVTALQPDGHDIQIISGRNDTYFSQKVRNLKSHNTLTNKGLADYDENTKEWSITERGETYLDDNEGILLSLQEQGFPKYIIDNEAEKDFEGLIIEEGGLKRVTVKQRKRSDTLRDLKIQELKKENDGKLICCACGFDFEHKYDGIGKGFIHIHHLEPIHEKDIEGERSNIQEALKKVVPLCSNCHSIVHRKRDSMLSIEELKKIIQEQEGLL